VTSTDAVNRVVNIPLSGELPGENLRNRNPRWIGDNAALVRGAHQMEVATILHGSEKKAKGRIVNTVTKWIEILIADFLLAHPINSSNTVRSDVRANFFTVMTSKQIRRAVALDIYEQFANRFEAKAKDFTWKDDDTQKALSQKKTVAFFLKSFDLRVVFNLLKEFWQRIPVENEENAPMEDDVRDILPRLAKSKPRVPNEGDDAGDMEEDGDEEEEDEDDLDYEEVEEEEEDDEEEVADVDDDAEAKDAEAAADLKLKSHI
jgi:hypothetical protein